MISPDHLLDQATKLLIPPRRGRPRRVDLRRAVSSAYYAVFHAVLAVCADEFVGQGSQRSAEYAMAYRSIDHRTAKRLCLELGKQTPAKAYQTHWPVGGFGADIQAVGVGLVELQEARHRADYDPHFQINTSNATLLVQRARSVVRRLAAASAPQKRLFAAYLLFEPRRD